MDKYGYDLVHADNEYMNKVPVNSKNLPFRGHFVMMNDGNAKGVRKLCCWPEEFQFIDLQNGAFGEPVDKIQRRKTLKCEQAPLISNQHTRGSLLCATHF